MNINEIVKHLDTEEYIYQFKRELNEDKILYSQIKTYIKRPNINIKIYKINNQTKNEEQILYISEPIKEEYDIENRHINRKYIIISYIYDSSKTLKKEYIFNVVDFKHIRSFLFFFFSEDHIKYIDKIDIKYE